MQCVLQSFGQLDEALDYQVTELGQHVLPVLLHLLWRAAQQDNESMERVGPAAEAKHLSIWAILM